MTRSNWIDHWVKAIQSGLVNTLAKGMTQSYTDLAAQYAVARVETFNRLHRRYTGAPRFTSRGIAHPTNEAFPPYLQPEVTFIEGLNQLEMVDTDVGRVTSDLISPFKISRSRGLSENQQRNLLATPPRGPINRLPFEQTEKETEEYESAHDNTANSVDTRSVTLVRLGDEIFNIIPFYFKMTVWTKNLSKSTLTFSE